ncbi:hypothetical protein AAG906_039690 [Vitis piasezkii]
MPSCNGKVVKQPNRFMYLGKSFNAILKEHEINLIDYDKAISDLDAHLWKKTMESEHGISLSQDQCPKTPKEKERMYLLYAMLCTRPDICFEVSMVSRYQLNPGPKYWTTIKHILNYLRRTRNYVSVPKVLR